MCSFLDRNQARQLWNVPQTKKLILFGAIAPTSDVNKGFKELKDALHRIQTNNVELVVFGSSRPRNEPEFGFKTHYLGHLHDDVSLATLYSAVDVMVVPSLQEAFGQTASESFSCGTPVVAFDGTGLSDIVDHRVNGYLARPFDTADLANGIDWILNRNEDQYRQLCQNAREKVLREFDSNVVARRYIELYKEVISRSGR